MTTHLTEFLFGSPSHLRATLITFALLVLILSFLAQRIPDYRRTIVAIGAVPMLLFAVSYVPLFGAGEPPAAEPGAPFDGIEKLMFQVMDVAPLLLALLGLAYATFIYFEDRNRVRRRTSACDRRQTNQQG